MLCFLIVKKRIERRKVMSCYHSNKNSRSQNSFLAKTAIALSQDGRNDWATNSLFQKKRREIEQTRTETFLYFHSKVVIN